MSQVLGILIIKFMKNQMTKLEKLCIKWLNDNFNHMEPFYMEEYPDYIFHMKNGKCILQYNKKNGYVYVSYREIWNFFESFFSMSYQQIKDVTKIWVEEHYKMGATSTKVWSSVAYHLVEEHYKMGVTSTFLNNKYNPRLVEEHYKMGVTSTNLIRSYSVGLVEEHYQEIKISYFDPPYSPEIKMDSEITNQPITDWPYTENFINKLFEQNTNG